MKKYKIIALIGESGAGKDSIMREVMKVEPGLHEIVSCTTRPKREGEKHGVNYFFLSNGDFAKKVVSMEMLEATCFNNWFYGTSIDSLDETKVNIGVFNPDGIDALLESPMVDVKVYYIQVTEKNRLLRQLNREENPNVSEIIRRFKTDQEDFFDLGFEYIPLLNNTREDFKLAVEKIVSQL